MGCISALPCISYSMLRLTKLTPKPLVASTASGWPVASLQSSLTLLAGGAPTTRHETVTLPSGTASAPYFAALVASS